MIFFKTLSEHKRRHFHSPGSSSCALGFWQRTFGNALACAPMIVTSPSRGLGLFNGVYCLMAICSSSFSCVEIALGKPRICEPVIVCSSSRKYCEDIEIPALALELQPNRLGSRNEGPTRAAQGEVGASVVSPEGSTRSRDSVIIDAVIVESLVLRCRDELPRESGVD